MYDSSQGADRRSVAFSEVTFPDGEDFPMVSKGLITE